MSGDAMQFAYVMRLADNDDLNMVMFGISYAYDETNKKITLKWNEMPRIGYTPSKDPNSFFTDIVSQIF